MMRQLVNAQGPTSWWKQEFFFRLAGQSAPTGFAIVHWIWYKLAKL